MYKVVFTRKGFSRIFNTLFEAKQVMKELEQSGHTVKIENMDKIGDIGNMGKIHYSIKEKMNMLDDILYHGDLSSMAAALDCLTFERLRALAKVINIMAKGKDG